MTKLKIIVGGFIGLIPAGGVTWDYIQYPLGFSLLGHDVYYIEDTKLYPIYQNSGCSWDDASSCIEHLKTVMNYFGFQEHWAYRDEASGKCFGLSEEKIKEICASADVFVNISCSTFLRDEYRSIPARILIDSDPMFTQIQYESQQMFTSGVSGIRELINGHNFHFTFGENIGSKDCLIPLSNIHWLTTRQPVCLEYWKVFPPCLEMNASFTTLMNWSAGKKLEYLGKEWGQKEQEFIKIRELPQSINGVKLSIGVAHTGGVANYFSKEELINLGWEVTDPFQVARDWLQYQEYIQNSFAEFSVAKHTYVEAWTGWFSCRSACYMAAGRPVLVQDTGWSKFIPEGIGAIAFHDYESAKEGISRIRSNHKQHSSGARSLAEEFFDSNKVLNNLLEQVY